MPKRHIGRRYQTQRSLAIAKGMDLYEERKSRLLYLQNLTHANINEGGNTRLKQQLNLKIENKFEFECVQNNAGSFRYTPLEEDRLGVQLQKGGKVLVLNDKEEKNVDVDRCIGCKSEYVIGINMRLRIRYEKETKRERKQRKITKEEKSRKDRKERKRVLEMKCFVCGLSTHFTGVLKKSSQGKENEKGRKEMQPLNTLPLVNVKEEKDKKSKGKSKSKGKKKKKGGLSELLHRKQEQEKRENDGGLGGLLGW